MKPIRNITLVYEFDSATLERAVTLAKEHRARLTIVYPVPDVPSAQARLTLGRKSVDVERLVRREQEARLKQAAREAQSLGIRPATRLLVGEPSVEIIFDVIDNERDLVIMTAEGKAGVRQRLFGSTSRHLMRKCPVPLLVTKPGRRTQFRRILAAVDPELTGGARDTLNDAILEMGAWLSARDRAQLHVAHAWTLIGESLFSGRAGMAADEIERLADAELGRRRRAIEALMARHTDVKAFVHLAKGDPGAVIPRLVRSHEIDLLVIGTVCRTGIPGFIIGNTAEKVLDVVECSVLTVKPAGFVSPVTRQTFD